MRCDAAGQAKERRSSLSRVVPGISAIRRGINCSRSWRKRKTRQARTPQEKNRAAEGSGSLNLEWVDLQCREEADDT